MCGIAATFGFVDEQTLQDMLVATTHRGPDERSTRTWGTSCGLGINRLSIVDVAGGQQPVSNREQTAHVVCNGEIYNAPAIRSDLEVTKSLSTRSDVEVIVSLYEDIGPRLLERLDGMFAFVLFDSARCTFIAARDRFGIKPLYYLRLEQRWHFASEIKAFLAAGLDLERVQMLPPGSWLDENGVHRYYHLELCQRASEPDSRLLAHLLDASVRRHLMADPEIRMGVYLSGGLDSSVLAALLAKYKPSIVGFSIGMPGSSDVSHAALVCAYLGIDHVVVPISLDQVSKTLPQAVYQMESYNPVIVLEGLLQMELSRAVQAHGIKVMFSGEGADEIFAGYGVHRGKAPEAVHAFLRGGLAEIHNTECHRVDRATMAFAVETRVPFLDPMVVEYALNLPASSMIRRQGGDLVEKWPLRKAFEHLLPAEVVWRPKLAFDHGTGVLKILDQFLAQVTDDELDQAQIDFPQAQLASKPILVLYRLFRAYFGDAGGPATFALFGNYPWLQEVIATRTSAGGTGEC